MELVITTVGDEDVKRATREIVKDVRDLSEAWDRFYRPHFHQAMEQTFATKQGGAWRPLKPAYAAWKSRHGGGSLMQLTGALRGSLTAQTGESIYRTDARQMEIGSTNMPTNTPRGRMVIYGNSTMMKYHIAQAAQEHAEEFGRTWQSGV